MEEYPEYTIDYEPDLELTHIFCRGLILPEDHGNRKKFIKEALNQYTAIKTKED